MHGMLDIQVKCQKQCPKILPYAQPLTLKRWSRVPENVARVMFWTGETSFTVGVITIDMLTLSSRESTVVLFWQPAKQTIRFSSFLR